ncbi:unnamed protein product [Wuchereria bancrofti]|uniref:Uncharacterized protein n=1 Tax=Wuchereria bancrofti TaxID=6293 RepID=A0A3P7EC49_WUCBA|nr:unnamed protein product [Wuchereria bancrofti]
MKCLPTASNPGTLAIPTRSRASNAHKRLTLARELHHVQQITLVTAQYRMMETHRFIYCGREMSGRAGFSVCWGGLLYNA